MKKAYLWIITILILLALVLFIRFFIGGSEDSWIKDSRGVWIKHGNPAETPVYVLEQQELIGEVLVLYNNKKSEGLEFNSQCLGVVGDYAVDIVHVPRSDIDNLVENQCEAYREGEVSHFIELDKEGNVVRIV